MWALLLVLSWTSVDQHTTSVRAFRAHMHERFARATLVQTALINGDLSTARYWAERLVPMAEQEAPPDRKTKRVARIAKRIAEADTVAEAATQTARLANACGDCHNSHGLMGQRFRSEVPVPVGNDLPQRMSRHFWAADRLWEGLVGHAESAWADGATVLLEAPLTKADLGMDQRAATELAQSVNAIGKKALETARWRRRADLYGRLLVTCAQCHRFYRD